MRLRATRLSARHHSARTRGSGRGRGAVRRAPAHGTTSREALDAERGQSLQPACSRAGRCVRGMRVRGTPMHVKTRAKIQHRINAARHAQRSSGWWRGGEAERGRWRGRSGEAQVRRRQRPSATQLFNSRVVLEVRLPAKLARVGVAATSGVVASPHRAPAGLAGDVLHRPANAHSHQEHLSRHTKFSTCDATREDDASYS